MEMKLTDMSAIMDSVVGDSLQSCFFPLALCDSITIILGISKVEKLFKNVQGFILVTLQKYETVKAFHY